jgi:predicted GIY-YIG superfamily endonuclease
VKTLVYFEAHETIAAALQRERTSSIGPASGRSI